MKKIVELYIEKPFVLLCVFANGEKRLFDLSNSLNDKYAKKLMNEEVFRQAKIGSFGEVYWENVAEIRNLKGELEPCQYDMSAEFVYENSTAYVKS